MNKHKVVLFWALVVTMLISALRLDSVALADAPPIRLVTWHYLKAQTVVPGREWYDKDGYHIRGRVDAGQIFGDIQGSAQVVYNADFPNISPEGSPILPKEGTAYGSIVIRSGLVDPTTGTTYAWSGTWDYSIRGGLVVSGRMVAMNMQKTQRMSIGRVYQNKMGYVVHNGYIEWLYCDGMPCR
jgi:hypothetical protein